MSMKRKTSLEDFDIRGGKEWKWEENKGFLMDVIDELYDYNSCDMDQEIFNLSSDDMMVMQSDSSSNLYDSSSITFNNGYEKGNANGGDSFTDTSSLLLSSGFESRVTVAGADSGNEYSNFDIEDFCDTFVSSSSSGEEQLENIRTEFGIQNELPKFQQQLDPDPQVQVSQNVSTIRHPENLENIVPNFDLDTPVANSNTFITFNEIVNERRNAEAEPACEVTKSVNEFKTNWPKGEPDNITDSNALQNDIRSYYNGVINGISSIVPDGSFSSNSISFEGSSTSSGTGLSATEVLNTAYKCNQLDCTSTDKVSDVNITSINDLITKNVASSKRKLIIPSKGSLSSQILPASQNINVKNIQRSSNCNAICNRTSDKALIKLNDFITHLNKNSGKVEPFDVNSKYTTVRLKINSTKASKAIQTTEKGVSLKKNNVGTVTTSSAGQSFGASANCFSVRAAVFEKIKRLVPVQDGFHFDFTVDIRCLSSCELVQENFVNNNEKMHYYTGIPQYSYFMVLLNCLDLPKNNVVAPFQMLLLTLIKMKLNLDWPDLGFRLGHSTQVVKDAFGLTTSILVRCFSKLIGWLPNVAHYPRQNTRFYLCCIDVKLSNKNPTDKILICLSNARHPVHFISKPISGASVSSADDLLLISGVIDGLVNNDVIVFDDRLLNRSGSFNCSSDHCSSMSFNEHSGNDSGCNTTVPDANVENVFKLLVSSNERNDFTLINGPCTHNSELKSHIKNLQKIFTEISKYKFLNDFVNCEWLPSGDSNGGLCLYCDVVTVACGLVNMCNILPFNKHAVTTIINERKSMKIKVT